MPVIPSERCKQKQKQIPNRCKKPLIVWGARQVGKTYLVEKIFAKEYYKNNYIYIDCKKEDEIREFCSKTANAEKIIEYISLRKGNELIAKEHKLFYWRGKASAELEFIIESNNKLYPLDVKKGRDTLNSLKKFPNHNKFEYAIKVSKNNYRYNPEQKLLTIPFYFIPFAAQDLADGTMKI